MERWQVPKVGTIVRLWLKGHPDEYIGQIAVHHVDSSITLWNVTKGLKTVHHYDTIASIEKMDEADFEMHVRSVAGMFKRISTMGRIMTCIDREW